MMGVCMGLDDMARKCQLCRCLYFAGAGCVCAHFKQDRDDLKTKVLW